METINKIGDINLHYARESQYPYGSIGRPANFQIDSDFKAVVEVAFQEVFEECPLGFPNVITCAGVYVDKEGSYHKFGRAFDIDASFWDSYTMITLNFFQEYELYLAIESFLRIHFGIVLNYFYNNDHRDHWHVDNSRSVDFNTGSRSSVLYMQMISSYIYENPVEIDGIYGPQTAAAIENILQVLDLSGAITHPSTYKALLRKTGKIAYLKFEQSKTPLRLLNNVYDVVSHLNIDHGNIMAISEALNDFKNHPETTDWLDGNFSFASNLDDLINEIV